MMEYSLVIVTYNAKTFLEPLSLDIHALTKKPKEIIIVDNSSTDGTQAMIDQYFPDALFFPQKENVDFCKGYNIGISHARTEYVVMINQRIRMNANGIEKMLQRLTSNDHIAVVGPKLLQPDGITIDSMGIVADQKRSFLNLGEGKKDTGQYDNQKVFGVTGAALAFRKKAFDMIAQHGGGAENEYFDNDFIAYKDDIDIAYRLRLLGWDLVVEPSALFFYERSGSKQKKRSQRSIRLQTYSLRNHWYVLLKNESLYGIIKSFHWILLYETMKITYVMLFQPKIFFRVVISYMKTLPRMLKKRNAIQKSAVAKKDLLQWFV